MVTRQFSIRSYLLEILLPWPCHMTDQTLSIQHGFKRTQLLKPSYSREKIAFLHIRKISL